MFAPEGIRVKGFSVSLTNGLSIVVLIRIISIRSKFTALYKEKNIPMNKIKYLCVIHFFLIDNDVRRSYTEKVHLL